MSDRSVEIKEIKYEPRIIKENHKLALEACDYLLSHAKKPFSAMGNTRVFNGPILDWSSYNSKNQEKKLEVNFVAYVYCKGGKDEADCFGENDRYTPFEYSNCCLSYNDGSYITTSGKFSSGLIKKEKKINKYKIAGWEYDIILTLEWKRGFLKDDFNFEASNNSMPWVISPIMWIVSILGGIFTLVDYALVNDCGNDGVIIGLISSILFKFISPFIDAAIYNNWWSNKFGGAISVPILIFIILSLTQSDCSGGLSITGLTFSILSALISFGVSLRE
jgi:hypothetical protein